MVARSVFSSGFALLAMAAVALVTQSRGADAFIVEMGASSQECYYEYVRTKRTAFLKIGVLESQDQYDIRLKAYGPFSEPPTEEDMSMGFFDQMVTTQRDQQSNDVQHNGFNFESEHRGGYYKFCLDNTHSGYNGKVVEFYTSFDLSKEDELGHEDEVEKYARQRTCPFQYVFLFASPLRACIVICGAIVSLTGSPWHIWLCRAHCGRDDIAQPSERTAGAHPVRAGVLQVPRTPSPTEYVYPDRCQ